MREDVLKTSDIESLLENARSALDDPEDEYIFQIGPEQGGEDVSKILDTMMTSLKRLNLSLESPAESDSDDEEARAGIIIQDLPAHRYFANLVAARFPVADIQLVQSLGLSNWSRYNHIQTQKENAQYNTKMTEKAKSEFHDSGVGSAPSIAELEPERPLSLYAATIVSSRAEASHKRLPPLPKQARDGEPFTCEICEKIIAIRRTKEWRSVQALGISRDFG